MTRTLRPDEEAWEGDDKAILKELMKKVNRVKTAHEAEEAMNEVRRKLKERIQKHILAESTGDENDCFDQSHLFVEEEEL